MNISTLLRSAKTTLDQANIPSAQLDAELLLAEIVGHDRSWLIAHQSDPLNIAQQKKYMQLIQARASRQPLAYIVAHKEFYGLDFRVTPDALIPRPETEIMVEQIVAKVKKKASVLDIGTGCGAIAIALASARADMQINASDVSAAALTLAKINADRLVPGANITFFKSNLFDTIPAKFDIIAANLPYVPNEKSSQISPEAKAEPAVALYGGADGLDLYRSFFQKLPAHINPLGQVYCESDPWQHSTLKQLAQQAGFSLLFEDYLICGFVKD